LEGLLEGLLRFGGLLEGLLEGLLRLGLLEGLLRLGLLEGLLRFGGLLEGLLEGLLRFSGLLGGLLRFGGLFKGEDDDVGFFFDGLLGFLTGLRLGTRGLSQSLSQIVRVSFHFFSIFLVCFTITCHCWRSSFVQFFG